MPRILDGRALAAARGEALRPRIALLRARLGRPPGLGVLLVGDDPAAQIYVRNKARAAAALGMASRLVRLPATAPAAVVLAAVEALNRDHEVDAFLVQLPLPAPLVAAPVIAAIAPGKDADGLLPSSLGRLLADLPGPRPCTPAAIMALLASVPVDLAGAHAVVLGRSAIVGRPAGLMLLQADATVTLCHALSRDVAAHARAADVLVVAVGQAGLVRADWVRPGAVVIDVGINRQAGRVVGDVDFAGVAPRAAAITPVPGGVGPMTIAMLLENAVSLAEAAALPAGPP